MRRTGVRAGRWLAVVVALASVAAACTSDDENPRPGQGSSGNARAELSVEVTGLSAEPDTAGRVRLSWDVLEGIPSYQVGYGDVTVGVPASICEERCELTVAPEPAGQTHEFTVRAAQGDAVSAPAAVEAAAPAASEDEQTPAPPLEVVLVYDGDPPEVERIPVGSAEQAQSVIKDAETDALEDTDRVLLSASLNTRTDADAEVESDSGGGGVPWQAQAMQFDLLPGERPGEGVTVAVIELDGLDAEHPVFEGASILDGAHLSDPSLTGLDRPELHSTIVTSMIAGQPGTAVPGIAPGATILPVNKGDGSAASLVEAMIWAVDNGADVVNVSVSGACESFGPIKNCPESIRAGAEYAERNGVVVVASAGNTGGGADWCDDPTDAERWPAVLDTVVSVGGHDQNGDPWVCTPDRPDVDLLAPAAQMLLPQPGGGYFLHHGGTSTAAPLVAGLIAAILAERPDLTPADIRAMLPRWRTVNGSVNVAAALLAAGVIEYDDPQTEDFENAEHVFPYRVDLLFEGDHPMSLALPSGTERVSPVRSAVGWSNRYSGDRQQDGKVFFGEIEGLLLVDRDGGVTGSAVFSYRHGSGFSAVQGDDQLSYHGHWIECPKDLGAPLGGYRKVFRWDIPVTVSGSMVPGTEDNPELDLTFSLGVGATAERPGDLPAATVPYDTMSRCKAAMDAYVGTVQDPYAGNHLYSSWGELEAIWQDYEQTMESVYETLVASSPFTLADPVQPGYTRTTTQAEGDPRVTVVFTDGDAARPQTYD